MRKQKKTTPIIIDGLEVTVTSNNIHIKDSYNIMRKSDMRQFLYIIRDIVRDTQSPFGHISIKSMVYEWVAHNNLYLIGFKRDRTGSVDINWPKKWYANLAYFLLGMIAF